MVGKCSPPVSFINSPFSTFSFEIRLDQLPKFALNILYRRGRSWMCDISIQPLEQVRFRPVLPGPVPMNYHGNKIYSRVQSTLHDLWILRSFLGSLRKGFGNFPTPNLLNDQGHHTNKMNSSYKTNRTKASVWMRHKRRICLSIDTFLCPQGLHPLKEPMECSLWVSSKVYLERAMTSLGTWTEGSQLCTMYDEASFSCSDICRSQEKKKLNHWVSPKNRCGRTTVHACPRGLWNCLLQTVKYRRSIYRV